VGRVHLLLFSILSYLQQPLPSSSHIALRRSSFDFFLNSACLSCSLLKLSEIVRGAAAFFCNSALIRKRSA
jgi:hypothetical protein